MIFGNTETSPWYITLLHILNHLVNNNGKIAYGVPTTCVIIFAYVLIQWPKSKKENFLGDQILDYEMKKFASKKLVKIKISLFKIGWNSIGLICKPEFKAFLTKIVTFHQNWKSRPIKIEKKLNFWKYCLDLSSCNLYETHLKCVTQITLT